MVRITEQLVRKRAEHNELEISTLEEVSLHQQDIEKIEYLDKWCRELKILYLQSNLIEKIENVSRLKKLEYLNLALNNVEIVENLEGCESLEKLDLTVNFVGELTSIESLKGLEFFRELYLTGNPCTDYEGYRDYVIATLPKLERLDGVEVEKSERILATQNLTFLKKSIMKQQEFYRLKREKEREEEKRKQERKSNPGFDGRWYTDINDPKSDSEQPKSSTTEEKENDAFWKEKVAFTPESRKEVHEHMQKTRERDERKETVEEKPKRRYFYDDGRAMNVNEPKCDFEFHDDESNGVYILDVAAFKHMTTSLMDADVHPFHVRVMLKGKIFQLALDEEVNPDKSTAQRSQTTGHLVITMPKCNFIIQPEKTVTRPQTTTTETGDSKSKRNSRETLEVDPSKYSGPDFGNIVSENKTAAPLGHKKKMAVDRENSPDFVDDPDVPPLI